MKQMRRVDLILLLVSTMVALVIVEIAYSLFLSPPRMLHSDINVTGYTVDDRFGYLPVLGTAEYTESGTLRSRSSSAVMEADQSVLFLGDSIVHRGVLPLAIAEAYKSDRYSFQHMGVSGYDVPREVRFLLTFGSKLQLNHVILFVHPNDLEGSPTVVHDDQQRTWLTQSGGSKLRIWPWLFNRSVIYRSLLCLLLLQSTETKLNQTKEAILELRAEIEKRHGTLSIVLLPYFKPRSSWNPVETGTVESLRKLLKTISPGFFDTAEVVETAAGTNVNLEERPGDFWHPGPEVSKLIANWLKNQGVIPESSK